MNALVSQETDERNPFKSQIATRESNNAIADAAQAKSIAEVQAAMVIAKRFPRNPIEAMDRILNAFARPTLAEGALYSYSRGGQDISGLSIRSAEVLAQNWGNMDFGIRELEQRPGESTVEAFAWDIETNTRSVKTFQVKHERHTKSQVKKLSDPRDIYEIVANQGARRLRSCILAVIPGDVQEAAVRESEKTLKTTADTSPEAMRKMVDAFKPFKVTKEQIEKRIQRRLDAIQPAQVVSLKKIYASLRDGMSMVSDWFDTEETAKDLTSRILDDKPGAGHPPTLTTQQVHDAIASATGLPELAEAEALIDMVPESERNALLDLYTTRKDELSLP
jgi:hypothetical protein